MNRRCTTGWLALLAALVILREVCILRAGPYVRHMDEEFLTTAAGSIVRSGSLEPRFYGYPSLPIYLSALGFAVGAVFDPAVDGAGSVPERVSYYPTYRPSNRGLVARGLFCLLGTLAVAFASWLVARLANDSVALVLAPLVAMTSPLIGVHTWTYLNVDIIGSCGALASLALFFTQPLGRLCARRTAAAGVLCGLAVASKYLFGLAVVPSALAILLTTEVAWGQRIRHLALLAATLAAGFLVAVPYFIPNLDRYLDAIAAELKHYRRGHAGFTSEPGLEHLGVQVRALVREFSPVGFGLGILGGAVVVHRSRRRGAALLAFPVLLLCFIALQRVNFQRNLLVVYLLFAAWIALGTVALSRIIVERTPLCLQRDCRPGQLAACAAAVFALFVASLPGARITDQLALPRESRVEVVDWILAHVPEKSTLVIPRQLFLSDLALRGRYRLLYVDFFRSGPTRAILENGSGQYVLMPTFGFDRRWPESGRLAAQLEKTYRGQGRVLKTFGKHPLLVNYRLPVRHGNPAFAVLKRD